MSFLSNIVWLCALSQATLAYQSVDLSNALNYTGGQDSPRDNDQDSRHAKKPLNDMFVGENNHSLAYLRANGPAERPPTPYSLIMRTHAFDGQALTKTCDVDPLSDGDENEWIFPNSVTFLRGDRVLVAWKEQPKGEEPRMKSFVVNTDTCRSSEPILFRSDEQIVVPFKSHFDVITYNEKRCSPLHYCNMSFDQDGSPVDEVPSVLTKPYLNDHEFMTIYHAYPLNYNSGEGMVLTGIKDQNVHRSTPPQVYSPITGWSQLDDVGHLINRYSNSSGFASICWFAKQGKEIDCKWIDDAHVDGVVLNLDLERAIDVLPAIHNTPDGRILLVKSGYRDNKKMLFVDKAHLSGKCSRIAEIAVDDKPIGKIRLSMASGNRYCLSLILSGTPADGHRFFQNTFATKCLDVAADAEEEPAGQCGKNYW